MNNLDNISLITGRSDSTAVVKTGLFWDPLFSFDLENTNYFKLKYFCEKLDNMWSVTTLVVTLGILQDDLVVYIRGSMWWRLR